jgi:hypothetical protein
VERELFTYPLEDIALRAELAFTLEHLRECGFAECKVLFGYAWGMEYYPDDQWVSEALPIASVLAKVAEVEGRGIGRLGSDDLDLEFPSFSFLFCNDSDVHLRFSEDGPLIEFFFSRWGRLGYKPAEWRTTQGGQKVKVRDGDANA